jgi:diacylglycerol O-acyltransferase / wax synthase
MTKKRETFSNVDAAWLHMETPSNMAMITGVITFDEKLDFTRLQENFVYRFLIHTRFRSRVREPERGIGLPQWEVDPNFDLDYHLQRTRLPEPGNQEDLQNLVGELMSTQLDFSRPLWQFHYVENYNGGSALIGRLHHCIADGMALIQVLLNMTDTCPDAPCPKPETRPARQLSPLARLMLPAVAVTRRVHKTFTAAERLVSDGFQMLIQPARVLDAARLGGKGTRALGKLLLIGPDRRTALKGRCDVQKRAAWSQAIPLDEVKTIGRLMGGTVNDVLLSAVTGALRRYLESRDQFVEGLNIRAVVPVNLRPPDDLEKLGNRFGLVFLSLPVGVRDPLKRLFVLKRRMDEIKNSPEAVVAFGILNAMGMTPIQIERIIVGIFGMKGTAVMTNVPGPREAIYMVGGRVRDLMFWVPQPGNLGIGVSIISYGGGVVVGIATDMGLVPDPETIVDYFHQEIEHLKRWGRRNGTDQTPLPNLEIEPEFETPAEEISSPIVGEMIAAMPSCCQAVTRAGLPCKNKPLPGHTYCRVHQKELVTV